MKFFIKTKEKSTKFELTPFESIFLGGIVMMLFIIFKPELIEWIGL